MPDPSHVSSGSTPNVAYASRYTAGSALGFLPLPGVCRYLDREAARVAEVGVLGASALRKAAAIVVDAMVDPKDLRWLEQIALASVPPEHRSFAREVIIASAGQPIRNFRADLLGDGTIAELQCPGSGWGFVLALEEMQGVEAEQSQVVATYRAWLDGRKAVWWLYNEGLTASIRHLCAVCQAAGINLVAKTTDEFDPNDPALGVVVKRPPLPMMVGMDKGRQLLARWMEGQVEMDPPPNVLFDSKHLLALLHHPTTRDRFTPEERGLAHPTFLVESHDQTVSFANGVPGLTLRLGDIPNVTRDRCPVVLKYAGADYYNRFGGHAVYSMRHMRPEEREQILTRALEEGGRGESWVAQPFVEVKRRMEDYGLPPDDSKKAGRTYYVLYRPGYTVDPDGTARCIGSFMSLRLTWKVHGSSDTYFGLVC